MGAPYNPYEKIYDGDLAEELAESEEQLSHYQRRRTSKSRWNFGLLSHAAAVITGIALCYLAVGYRDRRFQETCTDAKLRRSTLFPEELTRYTETVRYNGTLDFPSIYRGTWEEVDEAWNDLINVGYIDFPATEEDLEEIGVDDRETLAKFPEKDGGGYLMTVEYTHQIHCLDMLRRVNPWNYPIYQKEREEMTKRGEIPQSEELFRIHVDHCTEMLRQILMCHADTTPIFQQYVSRHSHPYPNFNTVHQCRNFNAIHKYIQEHVKDPSIGWPLRPDGAKLLPTPP